MGAVNAVLNSAETTSNLENSELIQSLEATPGHINDFYATTIETLELNDKLCSDSDFSHEINSGKEKEISEDTEKNKEHSEYEEQDNIASPKQDTPQMLRDCYSAPNQTLEINTKLCSEFHSKPADSKDEENKIFEDIENNEDHSEYKEQDNIAPPNEDTPQMLRDCYSAPFQTLEINTKLRREFPLKPADSSDEKKNFEDIGNNKEHSEYKEQDNIASPKQDTPQMLRDCYSGPNEAIEINKFCVESHFKPGDNSEEKSNIFEDTEKRKEHFEYKEENTINPPKQDTQQTELRCVHFEFDNEILKYQCESSNCSNCSDDLNSVISDLAENLKELRENTDEESEGDHNNRERMEKGQTDAKSQSECLESADEMICDKIRFEIRPKELPSTNSVTTTQLKAPRATYEDHFEQSAEYSDDLKSTDYFEQSGESSDDSKSRDSNHQENRIIGKLPWTTKALTITLIEASCATNENQVEKFAENSDDSKSRDSNNQKIHIIDQLPPTTKALTITQLKAPRASNENQVEQSAENSNDSKFIGLSHEKNRIIDKLFEQRDHTNLTFVRKYFLKWIHYTTAQRIEKQHFKSQIDRVTKINAFLDTVRREKRRLNQNENNLADQDQNQDGTKRSVNTKQLTKKYQNKLKIQQDIIDLQRIKLERQERMIMELKLNRIAEDAKAAREELKNEFKNFIRSADPKTKIKAKCLQLIGNLKDPDDNQKLTRLQGHALIAPTFLDKMQERALERSIRHEQARQRRLQQEAEREAKKLAAEEAKRLENEEAKRMRIETLKEKRRQEKKQKILKERERQRDIENNRKSQEYCRLRLLRRVGMEGFRRLVQLKRDNRIKCEMLFGHIMQKNCFRAWHNYCVVITEQKTAKANAFYQMLLKRQMLAAWKQYVKDERSKLYSAIDWHDFKLQEAMFVRWFGHSKRQKMISVAKMHQAESHYEWHLKWKVLDRWQRLPQILELEKETEARRQRWRMKIWELLPDYTPNRDAEDP